MEKNRANSVSEANANGSYDEDLTWIWRLYMRNISQVDADGVKFTFAKAPDCRFRIRINAKVFTVNVFSSVRAYERE